MAKMSAVSSLAPEPGTLSSGGEIDETLTPEEQTQLHGSEAPPETEVGAPEPEGSVELKPDETPEEAEAREAAERAPAERGLLNELKKERERRKAYEKQLAEASEVRARSDERLRIINDMVRQQTQPQGQAQPNPEPDKEVDPLAWYEWKLQQQDQALQQLNQNNQASAAMAQQAQMAQQIQMQEQAYAASNPQYTPSINKLAQHLDKMFEPMYPDAQQRQWAIGQWTRIAVIRAQEMGKNPAQLTYEIAQNAGLTEAEAQQAAATVAQVTQNAPSAQQSTGQPAQPTMRTVNTARRAAQSLSNTSGRTQNPVPTMEDLDKMSDAEFEEFRDRLKGKSVTQYFFNR